MDFFTTSKRIAAQSHYDANAGQHTKLRFELIHFLDFYLHFSPLILV